MSICCRPAIRPARPARTSRPGSVWRRRANTEAAWEALIRDNPMPAVHGRVCYHPCETCCNRRRTRQRRQHPRGRALPGRPGRRAQGWPIPAGTPASGKRVLVVGAGPSGLSAAYHLARLGHQVEIHDAGPLPGGMLHFGIPAYRLPRAGADEGDRADRADGRQVRAQPQG